MKTDSHWTLFIHYEFSKLKGIIKTLINRVKTIRNAQEALSTEIEILKRDLLDGCPDNFVTQTVEECHINIFIFVILLVLRAFSL